MPGVFCQTAVFIPGAQSLKDRRQVIRSVMDRLRSKCGATVAEAGFQDTWQRAGIIFAIVASDARILAASLEIARRQFEEAAELELLEFNCTDFEEEPWE